jgi:hypothetical protein
MSTTSLAPNHPDDLPIWARLQLAEQRVPIARVTHWIGSNDGRTIGVAVNDKPIYLTKN